MESQLDSYLEELSDFGNSLPQSVASSPRGEGEQHAAMSEESHMARQSAHSMPAEGELRKSRGQHSHNLIHDHHSRPHSFTPFAGESALGLEEQHFVRGSPRSLRSNSSGVFLCVPHSMGEGVREPAFCLHLFSVRICFARQA
jgi:hypothetical protein